MRYATLTYFTHTRSLIIDTVTIQVHTLTTCLLNKTSKETRTDARVIYLLFIKKNTKIIMSHYIHGKKHILHYNLKRKKYLYHKINHKLLIY